jgi:hypothetical protein
MCRGSRSVSFQFPELIPVACSPTSHIDKDPATHCRDMLVIGIAIVVASLFSIASYKITKEHFSTNHGRPVHPHRR